MKTKAALLPIVLLAGACAAVSGAEDVPAHGGNGTCDAARAQRLIGQAATTELGAEALKASGARTLRWIRPGDMVTADYREDRINIELDESSQVAAIRCG